MKFGIKISNLETSTLRLCPHCDGNGRNPEAPADLVGDDGTCLTCCVPTNLFYAGHHGYLRPNARSSHRVEEDEGWLLRIDRRRSDPHEFRADV